MSTLVLLTGEERQARTQLSHSLLSQERGSVSDWLTVAGAEGRRGSDWVDRHSVW